MTVRHDAAPRGPDRTNLYALVLLTLAILLGLLGFLFAAFWAGALVLMGILWGSLATQRQRSGRGVVANIVTAVVDEAHEISDSAGGGVTRRAVDG